MILPDLVKQVLAKRGRGSRQKADMERGMFLMLLLLLYLKKKKKILADDTIKLTVITVSLFFLFCGWLKDLCAGNKDPAECAKSTSNWLVKQFKWAISRAMGASEEINKLSFGLYNASVFSSLTESNWNKHKHDFLMSWCELCSKIQTVFKLRFRWI